MRWETEAVHAGHDIDPTTGAVTPTLVMSTTFARNEDYQPIGSAIYTRTENPNRASLETALAALEGASAACAFASGQAATAAVLHGLNPGDHVLLPDDLYFGTRVLLDEHYQRWGVSASYVDMTNLVVVERAIQHNTRLVWIETPSNPCLKLTDIAAVTNLAHQVGALVVADNTWASPVFTRPHRFGVDLVMHSTTKFIGGHSDVLGGALTLAPEASELARTWWDRITRYRNMGGAVPSPFDCWMLLRSIPTLSVRAKAQAASAHQIATWLQDQPAVRVVHYPGLESHPQHDLARQHMTGGFGAMLSIEVNGTADDALRVAKRTKLFTRATSLGGYESLIEHRFTVEGEATVSPPSLLRLSIGLEHVDDLIDDLDQALDLALGTRRGSDASPT
jgi:cystathionine gamma-synthase